MKTRKVKGWVIVAGKKENVSMTRGGDIYLLPLKKIAVNCAECAYESTKQWHGVSKATLTWEVGG